METLNVMSFFSTTTAGSLRDLGNIMSFFSFPAVVLDDIVIVIVSIAVIFLAMIIRLQMIDIAFYKIDFRLRNSILGLNYIFDPMRNIPLKRIVAMGYKAEEYGQISANLLDACINKRINSAQGLKNTLNNIELKLDVTDKKKQIVLEIITDSIGRIPANKLANIFTDCFSLDYPKTSDFKKEIALIISIVNAHGFTADSRSIFANRVLYNFNIMSEESEITEDERILLHADEVRFRMANPGLFKNFIPETNVEK